MCGQTCEPMTHEDEPPAFLQWALPRLRLRWAGFRKVRHQVCKRLRRRLDELRRRHSSRSQPTRGQSARVRRARSSMSYHHLAPVSGQTGLRLSGQSDLPELARTAVLHSRPVRCWCAAVHSVRNCIRSRSSRLGSPIEGQAARIEVIGTDRDEVVLLELSEPASPSAA